MKLSTLLAAFAALAPMLAAQTPATTSQPSAKLASAVFDWEKLTATRTPKGVRRDVFDGPTATLDKAHCHITTLNPGENSGEPRRHLQEEVIIVKEGLVETSCDGRTQTVGPGSTPATYIVFYCFTPLTPKN